MIISRLLMCFNPFPNKLLFIRFCCTNLLKTLWEKEKLLVTSNFSFSHSVFYPFRELSAMFIKSEIVVCKLFQFGRVLNLSFGKGLILSQTTILESSNKNGINNNKNGKKLRAISPFLTEISKDLYSRHV